MALAVHELGAVGRMREAGRPRVDGPHGRLGLLWAVVTVAAAAAGAPWLAAWLAATAGLAAAQVARSRVRSRPAAGRPIVALAGAGAAGVTSSAAVSPMAVVVVVGVVTAATVGYVLRNTSDRFGGEWLTVIGVALMVGVAGAAPVLLRDSAGLIPVLVLLAYAMAYDAGTYVVGSGAASVWEGPAAGIAAIGTVTLTVAAVAPPFRGSSPWLLGGLAAVLAPIGPMIASAFPGDPKVRVPALRRLDSLLVLGPLWAVAAALALD